MCGSIVPEFPHPWVPLERRLHDAALDASAAAMNQPHLMKAGAGRRVDVLGDNARDVAGRERVVEAVWAG